MSDSPLPYPTATSLRDLLLDARRVELELAEGLSEAQMLGTRQHFVEPPIWEIGHVGWFQEYWILRHLDGVPSLLPGSDGIYDSFNVSYTRRWEHRFPSREATLAYIAEVLRRSIDRLDSRQPSPSEAYFYTLAALHEDMHAENLTLIRQTLGYPRPPLSSVDPAAAAPPIDHAYQPRDVEVRGGTFMLGASPNLLHPGDERRVRGLRRGRWLSPPRVVGTPRLGLAAARASRGSALLGPWGRFALVRVPLRMPHPPRAMASRRSRQLVRGRGVLPLGGPPASQRGGVGNGR